MFVLPQVRGYTVEAVLGRGGMGLVFRARQHQPNRPVALKMLLAGGYASPQELARFLREIEAVAALRHPNIVQIYEVGDHGGRPYFTMELVEGGSLAQHLARGIPPVRWAAEVVATLAVTVQFAHQSGVIHRDLKPANILLTAPLGGRGSAESVPKIADFGLARFVGSGSDITHTGTRLGTPSYMAPEQALGRVADIGPAADIYALGAILYEALAGRPPFDGVTGAETERLVLTADPVRPSRANRGVSRDLETICLKCLHKNPARRYASARDLADDLHRFLDGRPVHARPIGAAERAVKWSRRHPVHTVLIGAFLVALIAGTGTAAWAGKQARERLAEQGQRELSARDGVEAAVAQAYDSARHERWDEARRALLGAQPQLLEARSDELAARHARAGTDVAFVQDLDRIRQSVTAAGVEDQYVGGLFTIAGSPAPQGSSVATRVPSRLAEEYRGAFGRAGYSLDGERTEAINRLKTSPLRALTVAALDQWAFAEFTLGHEEASTRILRTTRLIDPDPAWGDAFRGDGCWGDDHRLRALVADGARVSRVAAPHQLGIVATLLRNRGEAGRATGLLEEALRVHPSDFWLNWEVAALLMDSKKPAEAVGYLRSLVALRSDSAWPRFHLGVALAWADRPDASIAELRDAQARAPDSWVIRENLVVSLHRVGRPEEALAECRRAIEYRPGDPACYDSLGMLCFRLQRPSDAAAAFQKTVELDPARPMSWCNLGSSLGQLGRFEESVAAFRKAIELDPESTVARLGLGQCFLGQKKQIEAIEQFRWVVARLDPKNRADPDAKIGDLCLLARQSLIVGLLDLGRAGEAAAVATATLEFYGIDESRRKELNRRLLLARRLAPLEGKLPDVVTGVELTIDAASRLALAEWLLGHKIMPAAAARQYRTAFDLDPGLAADTETENRYNAARAAALAGAGGYDGARLSPQERAALRALALEWLRADYETWTRRYQGGVVGVQSAAARGVAGWPGDQYLAGVRDEAHVTHLPAEEAKAWRALWAGVRKLAASDPIERLAQARARVARKEWDQAVVLYNSVLRDSPASNYHVWFEAAAVRLLSGDRDGYRAACESLVRRAADPAVVRPYHAARASTLGPDAVADLPRVVRVSEDELKKYSLAFWSLTQQGALRYRAGEYQQALRLFERSLKADAKPGNAVLNWLWLALAHHRLNNATEARYWLNKASAWLDAHGGTMPSDPALALHEHNWLEANVLRREATELIVPRGVGTAPRR